MTPGPHVRTRGPLSRLLAVLPDRVDARVRVMAWATLVVQIAIVGTGGLVRLTGSGLGCPTWPRCTADSFVATPEMGIHGVIEFGNRLLTFVLVVIALLSIAATLRLRRSRRDLFVLAIVIALYVPLQAVIGGITVLTNLNPYVVGLHYFASVVLVALATVFVFRAVTPPGHRVRAVPGWYAAVSHATSAAVLATVGDGGARRTGLDPGVLQHVHSWPAYVTLALTVVLVAGAFRMPGARRLRGWTAALLGVELTQIAVGLLQARLGLPIALVNVHMVLAVVLVAVMTSVVLHLTTPAGTASALPERELAAVR